MSEQVKGYILGALAAVFYGMNPLFALPMLHAGMDAYSVLFLRYLIAIPILATIMTVRGRGFGLRHGQWIPLILMGVLMAASSLTLYLSYAYIGAAIASTLLFVYPIMVTVIMSVCYHERVKLLTVVCIVLACGGIALLYRGDDGAALSATGLLLVFISALTYAIYLVGVSRPALKEIPTLKMTLYVIIVGTIIFGTCLNASSFAALEQSPHLWLFAAGMALFPTAVSLLCTSAAILRIGSTPVAILGALEPVTAVVFAVLLFHEVLTVRLAIGMTLVILAVTLIIAGGRLTVIMLRVRKIFPRIHR